MSVKLFEKQIRFLKDEGYRTISCRDLYNHLLTGASLPAKPILLTFDQGHISQFSFASTILVNHGYAATFFAVGEWTLKSLYEIPGYLEFMHTEQLRRLTEFGNEIALLGYRHINFRTTNLNTIKADIRDTISFFEEVDLPFTKALAYPFGSRPGWFKTAVVHDILKNEGIQLAFENGSLINDVRKIDRFCISRHVVNGSESFDTFCTRLPGRNKRIF